MVKRRVYKHKILNFEHHNDQALTYDDYHDINIPIADLQIYTTKFQGGPKLSYEQWHALPDDTKKIWGMLIPEAKVIILHPFLTYKPQNPSSLATESLL